MKKWMKQFVLVMAVLTVLSGCSFGGDKGKADEQQTLRVMYYEESSFYQQYGMLFTALFPNINIEVISTSKVRPEEGQEQDYTKLMNEFIEKEQPDILMIDTSQYEKMATDGKLYELDGFIEKDKYDTEGLVPGMVDYLKEMGGGKLYGLSTSYSSQALYYNKDLFDKFGIDYPKDKMSFNELIQLAKRFPTDGSDKERIYGLKMGYSDNLFDIASTLAGAQNLAFFNAGKKEMTINTPAWKGIFEMALDAVNSKALYFESANQMNGGSYEDYLLGNPFISGRAAMTLDGSYVMQQLKQAQDYLKEKDQEKLIKNWDLVSVPVDPANPEYSSMINFYNIFAINNAAANKEAAWTFIKYITGDDFARVTSKSNNFGGFPIRTKYLNNDENRNLAAFYALKPSVNNMYKDYDKLPQNFYMEFNGTAQTELQKVKEGKATLDETLLKLQTVGQGLLDKGDSGQPPSNPEAQEGASGGAVSSEAVAN
ncbi:ABC transporter substrate-binding protein [Paenibacillus radicis (ex Gao et al. 2016)]|uniref:Sugar ABC transporter substrate-binding protein n=1 Tax=Paenibacillus radicis (ex Gao et al. 2016) TaxID=1737354 RepID=A0A917M488_9BACL|nr:ABC transporter substrate-binding protein [Paenibacillus radicis (ex Gao et al. 2016)]GGG75993.1 sugar ABC transporter substrate-binding protein [Paenibacillus radicis (ex Gao et al. 2016)]